MPEETKSDAAVMANNNKNRKQFSVIFHCISGGLNGSLLGSDEQEIVQIVYLIYDLSQNKVRISSSLEKKM